MPIMRVTLFLLAAAAASARAITQATETVQARDGICEAFYPHSVRNGNFEDGGRNNPKIFHWHTSGAANAISRGRTGTGGASLFIPHNLYPNQGDYALAIYSRTTAPAAIISQTVCLGQGPDVIYVPSFVYGYYYDVNQPTAQFTSAPSISMQLDDKTIYQSNVCGNKSATLSSTELCNTSGAWAATIVKLPRITVASTGQHNVTLTWTYNDASGSPITGLLDNVMLTEAKGH